MPTPTPTCDHADDEWCDTCYIPARQRAMLDQVDSLAAQPSGAWLRPIAVPRSVLTPADEARLAGARHLASPRSAPNGRSVPDQVAGVAAVAVLVGICSALAAGWAVLQALDAARGKGPAYLAALRADVQAARCRWLG